MQPNICSHSVEKRQKCVHLCVYKTSKGFAHHLGLCKVLSVQGFTTQIYAHMSTFQFFSSYLSRGISDNNKKLKLKKIETVRSPIVICYIKYSSKNTTSWCTPGIRFALIEYKVRYIAYCYWNLNSNRVISLNLSSFTSFNVFFIIIRWTMIVINRNLWLSTILCSSVDLYVN